MQNRPQGRPQGRPTNVTGNGAPVKKRGSGLGTGPVGQSGGYAGRKPGYTNTNTGGSNGQTTRAAGTRRSPLLIIIIVVIVLFLAFRFGFCGRGGSDNDIGSGTNNTQVFQPTGTTDDYSDVYKPGLLSSLLGASSSTGSSNSVGNYSSGWNLTPNTSRLNTSVDPAARAKRTQILGSGRDTVTVMVYMCGADLESKSGMGTRDLMEMTGATIGSNVNVIVCTGGSTKWQNNVVSSNCNQIYQVVSGGLHPLEKDFGNASMTNPATLTSFINYCAKNFPANRNELILWDHGGGSITGYGYDEKNPKNGAMNLERISKALFDCDVNYFDFIGFDACLMGTLENALTLTPYADYLIASEETEPGIGWYYTDWLTAFSSNTSMQTIQVGKQIIDDFVTHCASECRGQKATLSIVDLAELEKTVPDDFRAFSVSTSELMKNDGFKTVSDARSCSRAFAVSSQSDQVDLVDLATNIGTNECRELADTLLNAVKYNRTSSDITNAYGISIYFPYQKMSKVSSAVAAYDALGLESEYSRCIQQFASMESGGQAAYGSSYTSASSPLSSLLGGALGGSSSVGSSVGSSDMIGSLLGSFFGGSSDFGLDSFLGRGIDSEYATGYIMNNGFDPSALVWTSSGSEYVMRIPDEQWSYVHDLKLNVFVDDGEGYIDLGLDCLYDFTDDGALRADFGGAWLAVNNQPVAYYHIDAVEDGNNSVYTGRVPVMVNGSRADLIIVTDAVNGSRIAGVRYDYRDGETDTIAKSFDLQDGDVVDFLCDYYTYGGEYVDSYYLGDRMTYNGNFTVSDVYLDSQLVSAMYVFTDIYCNEFWTPVIP